MAGESKEFIVVTSVGKFFRLNIYSDKEYKMKNLTPKLKNQIKQLVDSDKLIEAINLLSIEDDEITIIMLKSQINSLIKDRSIHPESHFINQMERIKKAIYEMIGLKYMPKVTIEKITPSFDYPEELLKKLESLLEEIKAFLLQTSDDSILLLKRRMERLIQSKDKQMIDASDFKIELNRLERSFIFFKKEIENKVNQNLNTQQGKTNQLKSDFQKLTIKERLIYLFDKIPSNNPTYKMLKKITLNYEKIQQQNNAGLLTYESYTIQLNQIDMSFEEMFNQFSS